MTTRVEPLETADGGRAWRAFGHPEVAALMEDRRLAIEHPDPRSAQSQSDSPLHRVLMRLAARPTSTSSEHAERTWRRRTISRLFSSGNLQRTTPDVVPVAKELLEDLIASGAPADVSDLYSTPLCARVICQLLGVPSTDVARFRAWAAANEASDVRVAVAAMRELIDYVNALVDERLHHPGGDVVSELLAAAGDGDDFHEGRVGNIVSFMLGMGWQVSASAIDFGALLLMTHDDQRRLLLDDPSLVDSMAEEVLRLFDHTAGPRGGIERRARADVEIGDVTIREGDLVVLEIATANRDPRVFEDPDVFDIRRAHNPHLTFGHGFYVCDFRRVVRSKLQVGLQTLLQGLPDMRLACPPEALEYKDHPRSGVVRLPVTW